MKPLKKLFSWIHSEHHGDKEIVEYTTERVSKIRKHPTAPNVAIVTMREEQNGQIQEHREEIIVKSTSDILRRARNLGL